MGLLLLLVAAFAVSDAGRFGCPTRVQISPCLCTEKSRGLDISCENAKEEQLREALMNVAQTRQAIWYLKLRNNKLGHLSADLLRGLDVRHLIALHCNLSSVDRLAFQGQAEKLETLDLAQNGLERVPSQALEELSALVSLNLNYNKLEILHAESFKGLHSLLRLSLYGNRIKFIDNLAFNLIGPNLTRINLGANQLTAVPSRPLRSLSQLQRLQLHENQIEQLLPEEFVAMGGESLDVLDMANNRVRVLPRRAFVSLVALNSLDLERNLIEEIDTHAFQGIEADRGPLSQLQRLQLHENQIEQLLPEEFVAMGGKSLYVLDMANNRVRVLPRRAFVSLVALNSLDLERNLIEEIDTHAFQGIEDSLEWVKLGVNRLEEIPSQSLRNLTRLRQLDLRGNNISKVQEDDFMPYGKNLKFIYLQNNWLTSVDPMSLVALDSLEWLQLQSNQLNTFQYETYSYVLNTLQVFDIYDNPIHCDCKIAWLREWIQKKGNDQVRQPIVAKCETPEDYQNLPLAEIPNDQLVCVNAATLNCAFTSLQIFTTVIWVVFLMS